MLTQRFNQTSMRKSLLHEMNIGPLWQLRVPTPPGAVSLPEVELAAALAAPSAAAAVPAAPDVVLPDVGSMSWELLQATTAACTQCGLCHGRTQTVFGSGDRHARCLFVGEGPGYHEDLQGQPFVGAAGQLLDNMLRALGVGRDAYIANVVKCRATDQQGRDRVPDADEVAACLPYLQRQIALIQPQVIVALGKTAAVSLLGLDAGTPLGQLRGTVHRYRQWPVIVTYHPAYLLRKPAVKAEAWADLFLVMRSLTTA
ncbi:MAG: uracil-DNA glycosylase [Burkholderiales bacterium]|nr:uracil-DNA glycosylase [Burkholderiales bacterium]